MRRFLPKLCLTIVSAVLMPALAVAGGKETVSFEMSDKGTIERLYLRNIDTAALPITFRTDMFAGPSLLLDGSGLDLSEESEGRFAGRTDTLAYRLALRADGDRLAIDVECTNLTGKRLDSLQFSLQLGIDTEMVKYPEWRDLFFPTMMRAEKTHLWGYLMSPSGRILTVTSPDPVASFRYHYNNKKVKRSFDHGHRIRTVSLDLLNPGPLPERHPQNSSLAPHATRRWRIYIEEAGSLDDIFTVVNRNTGAPAASARLYSVVPGQSPEISVIATGTPSAKVTTPDGIEKSVRVKRSGKTVYSCDFTPDSGGVYTFVFSDRASGKRSEIKITCRSNAYSDYIRSARRAALKYPQIASSHTEGWYGFFPAYIAREHFPEPATDSLVDKMFRTVYPLIHDTVNNIPTHYMSRIQNSAMMASLFAQRYRSTGDIEDLRAAADLADYIMAMQSPDGAYRNGRTHYTAVIYVAKAIMEVMELEARLADGSDEWADNYRKHYHSVRKAIDELTRNLDNIQTEGEMTFEDGMISCSYTQISQFALLQPEGSAARLRYTEAAEKLASMHRCLSQIVVPDSRMNGGSLRYWEAQYDILSFPDMMNSPHGWSAWRIYGLRNLYLLTGKYEYLRQMANAIGSCIQLLDPETDNLNWAFIVDPYIEAEVFVNDSANPGKGRYEPQVIGEQYMPMIGDWYHPEPLGKLVSGYWKYDGGCCNNDVHEIFKCLGEILLTSAYVHQLPDGSLRAFNCHARLEDGTLKITPAEECVSEVHVNMGSTHKVDVAFRNGSRSCELQSGWIKQTATDR